jgi:hypothetical protein
LTPNREPGEKRPFRIGLKNAQKPVWRCPMQNNIMLDGLKPLKRKQFTLLMYYLPLMYNLENRKKMCSKLGTTLAELDKLINLGEKAELLVIRPYKLGWIMVFETIKGEEFVSGHLNELAEP